MESFCLLLDTVCRSFVEAGEPGSLLMGISGGGDSVALMIALSELANERSIRLHAVHVNHGLRPDADDDEAYVCDICTAYDIPLSVLRVNVSKKGNLESAARDARYTAFKRVKDETKSEMLVLAHHADDQTETVMMHLFRGAGSAGLGGMNVCSRGIWRPFLNLRKCFLLKCLEEKGITWREDPTNSDPAYLRNSLRINLVPAIEQVAPQAVKNICRSAELLRAEENYFRAYSETWLKVHANCQPPCRFLLAAPLLAEHIAIQRHVLRMFCSSLPGPLTLEQTDRLRYCLAGETGSKVNLPFGFHVLRTCERLHLIPPEPDFRLPDQWQLDLVPFTGELGDGIRGQAFDSDAVAGAELRTRHAGDRIVPLGATGSQTLKQYLIDRHIDQPFRAFLPCLAKGNMVLWVVGVGVAQTAAISDSTQNRVFMQYRGILPDEIYQRGK